MWIISLLGCPEPVPPVAPMPAPTGPTADDTGFVGEGDLDADCVPDPDHPLVIHCTVRFDAPAEATLSAWHPERPDRIRRQVAPEASIAHTIRLWGFKSLSPVRWQIDGSGSFRTGEVKTGALPSGLSITYTREGEDPSVEGVLVSASCVGARVHMVDHDGDIIWYADLGEHLAKDVSPAISALHRTPDDTVLAVVGRSQILEVDLLGNVLLSLERGVDFEHHVHHDIFRHDGHTYVPYARTVSEDGSDFLVDGVYVFDAAGRLVESPLVGDLWPLVGDPDTLDGYWALLFPGAFDVSHANSISVDSSGELVVSFRHLHTVVGLQGGPGTAGFGQPIWSLVGDPASVAAPGDFVLTGPLDVPSDFRGQHDAHVASDGSLLLLDNRLDTGESTRVLRLALDADAGIASVIESRDLGQSCPIQGTARELTSGGVLAVCSSTGELLAFPPGEGDPIWQLNSQCGFGLPILSVPRGIPWPLWTEQP